MPINFGIIGGDARQLYLAKSLEEDGHSVYLSCLENAKGAEVFPKVPLKKISTLCETVILPLPVIKGEGLLNAPFSAHAIKADDEFAKMLEGCTVLAGMTSKLPQTEVWQKTSPIDYYSREELISGNAVLTAEAAIAMAIQEYPGALNGASCLVTGFGRIGKSLCDMLHSLYAKVDCAARKKLDFMMIQNMGCQPVQYQAISRRYDIIFNTVPSEVLGEKQLASQDKDTIIIELASLPGGVCLETAQKAGIRVIDGQSLPGRVSPKTSGEYIKQTVYNILEE
ncbi:dipicolinate synthase subunit DpsA [Scatolibacter rhodanostii]|uniref:dipicolinate synthase subunit DpsA n=1 Tax=Scatolibacter rhodanostii TaxID=2014781 RepID=UPI001356299A|nr:dipicolinate synthase subunit DpsA [Scatolibacter rhodanostii]